MSVAVTTCPDPARWAARLAAKSAAEGDCMIWTGRLGKDGYGVFKTDGRDGPRTGAHRAAWLAHRGPIPDGMVIDHLCRERRCLDPNHMEVVTPSENTRRMNEYWRTTGLIDYRGGKIQTHCKRGHEFDEANTRWKTSPAGNPARNCRTCAHERYVAACQQRKAAA